MESNFEALAEAWPRILDGLWITLQLTLGGALLAMVIAVILGLGSRLRNIVLRGLCRAIMEFFRGTSLVVQLFFFFFVLPQLGLELPAMVCGILGLGLNYGAYAAEVVRGSINSVPTGQWEATTALSMSKSQQMIRVIFPQAWALMIPSLTNYLIHMLKGTAIVSFITLADLTYHTEQLREQTDTFFAYGVSLVIYFVIAYILTLVMNALEVRAKHRLGRGESLREALTPKTPETAAVEGGRKV
ncbi:ectoine/hydroxyectoine ABC transporter permease subunit EhuC [Arthrobacter crystallopoietes]|jgi:polar amino acid transport system permease protein|uniref:Amino acid ABC transporter membrane protein 1, PAAT family n=1 Tax=Crystallibacter crystallopoietes TaxID=37928 RepID=A0A1H1C6N5_9MICC|nr:ectoine/hydroxyectoine ABC transporter permease subunit EhuC [Arthrobacter crystallopoietes]AUI50856.1 ectoine/hydroxyectoine ABC transporter permease subunit EhuC [Arthrobacter crystallopoietes]SDQ59811.1 amino acid ABC transporter membrane protein 1, PAAT family [Arthrobacter crystallopoietes]